MKFNIYLKNKNAEFTNLYLFISYKGERIKLSLGVKVPAPYWDFRRNEVKSNFKDYQTLNNLIETKSKLIRDEFYSLSNNKPELSLKDLKVLYDNKQNQFEGKLQDDFNSLVELIDKYNIYLKNSKSKNSLKGALAIRKHIIQMNKTDKLTLSKIDKHFPNKFLNYCVINGISNNYFINMMKKIKTIMNWGFENELHSFTDYLKISPKNFVVSPDEIETFSLNRNELNSIIELELNEKYLERARDLFVFACLTGQRYIDYKENLSKNSIDGEFWRLRQKKTNTITNIPLNELALSILEKYDYDIPVISNQKINDYLKEIGKRAGLNRLFTRTRKSGNNQNKETKPVFDILSFHDARRTFISISSELGMSTEIIRKISGHKTYKEFSKYLNIEEDRMKDELSKWTNMLKNTSL